MSTIWLIAGGAIIVAVILAILIAAVVIASTRKPIKVIYKEMKAEAPPDPAKTNTNPAPPPDVSKPTDVIHPLRGTGFFPVALTILKWLLLGGLLLGLALLLILNWTKITTWFATLFTPTAPPPAVPAGGGGSPAVTPALPSAPDFSWFTNWVTWVFSGDWIGALSLFGWGLLFLILGFLLYLIPLTRIIGRVLAIIGGVMLVLVALEKLFGFNLSSIGIHFDRVEDFLPYLLIALGIGLLFFLQAKFLGRLLTVLGVVLLLSSTPFFSSITSVFSGVKTAVAPVGTWSAPIRVPGHECIAWWGVDPEGEAFTTSYADPSGNWKIHRPGTSPELRAIRFQSETGATETVHYTITRKRGGHCS